MDPHRARHGLVTLIGLVVALTLLSPAANAQEDGRVVLVAIDTAAETRVTEEAVLAWRLISNDPARTYTIFSSLEMEDAEDWTFRIEPQNASLAPAGTLRIEVHALPGPRADPRTLELTLTLVATSGTEALVRLEDDATVRVYGSTLVLGQWENPLPPPLHASVGAFLLNLAAWLVISLLVMWFINPTMKAFTARTKTDVDDHIIEILKLPIFLILFTHGIKQSLEVFRLPTWLFHLLDRLWGIALVFAIVYVAYRGWQEVVLIFGRRVAKKTESNLDDRLLPVFEKIGGIIILVIGVFYIVSTFGIDLTVFAAGGVLVSMVIAFAAQDTLSNFFSGIHLMLDQPFKEGDWIVLDTGELTTVSKIGLRSTHLYHVANHESIIVPNNLLATNRIINILKPDTRSKVRVDVGVAYGTDVKKVQEILLDIAHKHPLALDDPEHQPFVRFQNFGASSLDFSLHFWVKEVLTRWAAASDARAAIDQRFKQEGIEIPFPQRVVWDGDKARAEAMAKRTGGKGGSILDHPKVKRDVAPAQPSLPDETGAEPGSSAQA